jgi:hypothetical protein
MSNQALAARSRGGAVGKSTAKLSVDKQSSVNAIIFFIE